MNSNVIDEKLENLFDEWKDRMKKNGDMNFTKDGILRKNGIPDTKVIETWMASSKRIMFLLKDQNQEGGKWDEDIRDWLTVNENASNLGSIFLKNIAYILWGLSKADENNDWWYNEVTMHFDEVKEYFNTQPFALVECKKQPGDGQLNDDVLKQHLSDYGDLLKQEIDILNPNIIVCTNQHIYDFILKKYLKEELECIDGYNSIRFHPLTGTIVLCSYHPSAWNVDVYEGVMWHYRAFLKKHYQPK